MSVDNLRRSYPPDFSPAKFSPVPFLTPSPLSVSLLGPFDSLFVLPPSLPTTGSVWRPPPSRTSTIVWSSVPGTSGRTAGPLADGRIKVRRLWRRREHRPYLTRVKSESFSGLQRNVSFFRRLRFDWSLFPHFLTPKGPP